MILFHNENNDIDYAFHIKGVKNDTDIKKIKFKELLKFMDLPVHFLMDLTN